MALKLDHVINDARCLIYVTWTMAVILSFALSFHDKLHLMDKKKPMSIHDVAESMALEDVMSKCFQRMLSCDNI